MRANDALRNEGLSAAEIAWLDAVVGPIDPSTASSRQIDAVIDALGRAQHDHVARWQLLNRGVSSDAIKNRFGHRLRHARRGVYKVGPTRTTRRGTWMADVLRCGPDSGLDGISALQLFGVIREYKRPTTVVTKRRGRRAPKGIDLRTTTDEIRFLRWDGIPTVDVTRALATAAPHLDDEQLEAAYEKALTHFNLDPNSIPQRNSRLNKLIKDHERATAMTDSELENLFRRIIKGAKLSQPKTKLEVDVEGRRYHPDFIWPEHHLVAEVNGPHHLEQTEADASRNADLSSLGLIVQTFTKLQMLRHPEQIPPALRPFL